METRDKNTHDENLSRSNLGDARQLRVNLEFKSTNALRSVSREEMKREASKPLYLARYE